MTFTPCILVPRSSIGGSAFCVQKPSKSVEKRSCFDSILCIMSLEPLCLFCGEGSFYFPEEARK